MKLSAFNSFLAFFRKKAGMSGAGSKRFLAFSLFLAAFLVSIAAIYGVTWRDQASAQIQQVGVKLITESLRITATDGTRSIAQLISSQSGIVIPSQAIANLHFFVDPTNNSLIFSKVGAQNPLGFQWAMLPGQDKKFALPKTSVLAPQALGNYLVRSNGATNFIVTVEFYLP